MCVLYVLSKSYQRLLAGESIFAFYNGTRAVHTEHVVAANFPNSTECRPCDVLSLINYGWKRAWKHATHEHAHHLAAHLSSSWYSMVQKSYLCQPHRLDVVRVRWLYASVNQDSYKGTNGCRLHHSLGSGPMYRPYALL